MIHNSMVQRSGLKVNGAETVEILAGDTIKIGDVIYTVNTDANTTIVFDPGAALMDIHVAKFSPDGSLFVINGGVGELKVFSVDGYILSYIQDITVNDSTSFGFYNAIFYDKYLILETGGNEVSIDCYKIDGNNFTNYPLLNVDNTYCPLSVNDCGELIISKRISVESQTDYAYTCHTAIISNQNLQIVGTILPENNQNSYFNTDVMKCAISPNNNYMVLCGFFDGKAIYYSCEKNSDGYVYNPISHLYADAAGTELSNNVRDCKFSPDNSLLVFATGSGIYIYSVNESGISFKESFYTTERFNTVEFSPDSKYLYVGGNIDGGIRIFSIGNDKTITYVRSVYGTTKHDVREIALNPYSGLMFVAYADGDLKPPISDAYIVNEADFSVAVETAYPIVGNTYTIDSESTYIGVAKSNANDGGNVKMCRVLKITSPQVADLSLISQIIDDVVDGTSSDA